MDKQTKLDTVFMNMAKEVATLSHCVRTKVGSLIVNNGNVISFGYNGMPSGMDNDCESEGETKREVLHSESNAILKAAKNGFSTNGATLYLTMSPCIECSKLIIQSGIARVVYLQEYRDISGLVFLKDFVQVQQFMDEVQKPN